MLTFVRSHRRRRPLDHVLIVGVAGDLQEVSLALAMLPDDAYGQVLLAAAPGSTSALTAPARVSIHRLEPSRGCLVDAVSAWLAEWVPQEPDGARSVTAWVGPHAKAAIDPERLGLASLTIF